MGKYYINILEQVDIEDGLNETWDFGLRKKKSKKMEE